MIQWTSIFCFLALCATLTYADIGGAVAGKVSKCAALANEAKAKMADAKADGNQAMCAASKSAEMIMDAFKGTELEKSCTPDCEKVMTMAKEDEEEAKKTFAEEKEQLSMKEWEQKMQKKHEEMKKSNPDKVKAYEAESKKCQDCGKKHLAEIEKKCEEMKADAMVKTVRSTCGF
ncbi:uncharacterized protein LOC107362779 [Tetranychus urticae]|uniref:Uncharacterized protein n=1 Tax=Tetranychus urticae TaxID=32264 RepID=T1KC24_TETUR|nr:uncharacterized protein LOC107362779 [Tetranychus urticae]